MTVKKGETLVSRYGTPIGDRLCYVLFWIGWRMTVLSFSGAVRRGSLK